MEILLILTFVGGYLLITLEHKIALDKAASALLMGVMCWVVLALSARDAEAITTQLTEHMGGISEILFFLLGAMTIVEMIDLHGGFRVVTERIRTTDKRKLFVILGLISFFLSAVLDNLTTAIVMASLSGKILDNRQDRLLTAGLIVISANAGGAWSPIGDVTTTMLWIGNQVTSTNLIKTVFLPSLACLLVPMLLLARHIKGHIEAIDTEPQRNIGTRERNILFVSGIGLLLFVPVFKTLTHLPPFMGIMFAVGVLWIVTEILHKSKLHDERKGFTVIHALQRIDTPSILFFLGILLAVAALETYGTLHHLAQMLQHSVGNNMIVVTLIGLFSAVFDNVPLVAAVQGMYSLEQFPTDHTFWHYLAYCAGTGGSILIIGSAAGVTIMGIEKIEFFWYLKKISFAALAGFLAGAGVYLLLTGMG